MISCQAFPSMSAGIDCTADLETRPRFSISSAPARMRLRQSSMRKMCSKIQNECCGYFAGRSVSILPSRCFPGRQACEKPMVFGRSIGMTKWQDRHLFGRIVSQITRFRSACVKFTTAAANAMSSFIGTDCVKDHPQIHTDFSRMVVGPRSL